MKRTSIVGAVVIAVAVIAAAALWFRGTPEGQGGMAADMHQHGEGEATAEVELGPHGGRLLHDEAVSLEITIYESGLPPEMRLYAFEDGEPLEPARISATVELERLGGRRDVLAFVPEGDYLRSDGVVREPHSFDVDVSATVGGRTHAWRYASYEGRTQISPRAAAASRLDVEPAGPATIVEAVELTGVIQTDPARVSRVRPRFAGVVTDVRRTIGDRVGAGDELATIETNESLRSVPVTAPIDGLIVNRDVQVGQVAGSDPIFVIADLSEVWIQLDVFGDQMSDVDVGQTAEVRMLDGLELEGTIDWISPLVAHGSQSVRARVTVANSDYRLRPGQFVQARVITDEIAVPLAVKRSALQTFRDFDVVFARVGDVYEVRMLELGRMDGEYAEVLGGLEAGEIYVTEGSFLIKADIEKSGATHDH